MQIDDAIISSSSFSGWSGAVVLLLLSRLAMVARRRARAA
jgi:hypothetical protein